MPSLTSQQWAAIIGAFAVFLMAVAEALGANVVPV